MSFSSNVKAEICRAGITKRCCALAECYGILLYCNRFSPYGIKIITENRDFATRLPRLFRKAFGFEFDAQLDRGENGGKNVFLFADEGKIKKIYEAFGLAPTDSVTLHLNRGALENECCEISFLRGAFLAGGSAIDPEKRYHLELVTAHGKVSAETHSLLLDLGFRPKDAERNGSSTLYFKQSDRIEDFLTTIGAPVCAMSIMEAKVEKDLRNGVNRRCNCETANLSKAVDAAQDQLSAIRSLRAAGKFDSLPPKLRETAALREEDPSATFAEMALILGVSKPAVSHRMRKLIELSKE